MGQDINDILVQDCKRHYALLYMYDYVSRDDIEKYKRIMNDIQ